MTTFKRVAHSLDVLLAQLNEAFPNRSKASDGALGDAHHAASVSDHNPNDHGIVTARDFTNDPINGPGNAGLLAVLLASRDKRIKYIIADRKIYSGEAGPQPWVGRPYNGSNAHEHHLHLSVRQQDEYYDDTSPWNLGGAGQAPVTAEEIGSTLWLQRELNKHGFTLREDGDEGDKTKAAIRAFAVSQLKGT